MGERVELSRFGARTYIDQRYVCTSIERERVRIVAVASGALQRRDFRRRSRDPPGDRGTEQDKERCTGLTWQIGRSTNGGSEAGEERRGSFVFAVEIDSLVALTRNRIYLAWSI